jgi:hypothetical protein
LAGRAFPGWTCGPDRAGRGSCSGAAWSATTGLPRGGEEVEPAVGVEVGGGERHGVVYLERREGDAFESAADLAEEDRDRPRIVFWVGRCEVGSPVAVEVGGDRRVVVSAERERRTEADLSPPLPFPSRTVMLSGALPLV